MTPETSVAPGGAVSGRSALYRTAWRWHFYAGLLSIPVIVLLCITGIVYSLRPQLDGWLYGDARNVDAGEALVPFQQQLETVRQAYPDEPVVGMEPPSSTTRATEFHLDNGGTGGFMPAGRTVFVDPYTGEITGNRNNAMDPSQVAVQLHGSLMSANVLGDSVWGDRLIELVASWSVLLLVTGVFLWWPRGRSGSWRSAFVPRWRLRGSRLFVRDLHAVTGVVFSGVLLFFLLTGLSWTGVWGANYGEIASNIGESYPEAPAVEPGVTAGDVRASGTIGWAQSELPVVPSVDKPAAGGHQHGAEKLVWDPADAAPLDAIVAEVQRLGVEPGYVIYLPGGEDDAYQVFKGPDSPGRPNQSVFDERTIYIDQYSGRALADYRYGDYGFMAQAWDFGISFHEGREWGLPTQILAIGGTLAILVSVVTGVLMWLRRRPELLGAPRRVTGRGTTLAILAVTVTLGVVFPLLGLSIVGLLIFDVVVLRRVGPLARALRAI